MTRFVRFASLAAAALAVVSLAASPRAQAKSNKRHGDTDVCQYAGHGTDLDKQQNGLGPGGQGGGKPQKTCSKVFAKWADGSVNVFVDDAGAPAGFGSALSSYTADCYTTWACDSGLTFQIVQNEADADITVTWGDLGSTGILGQTTTYYLSGIISASDVVMNSNTSAFDWTTGSSVDLDGDGCLAETANGNTTTSNYDLVSVLLHEIGHSLGVSHPTNRCSTRDDCYYQTMNPCTDAEEYMRRTLEAGDIKSIQTNYGL